VSLSRLPPADGHNGVRPFLDTHWQQQPLWLPRAVDCEALPQIDADELAWLATLDDVESRLVTTSERNGRRRYALETGPFDSERLETLPPRDWTLLIQDVDKHLPEFRHYFDLVPFVPDWRIDDLMISVAAPGGSVGPHVDNYDVFLLQTEGSRRWQWTVRPVAADPSASDALRLVEAFDADGDVVAHPGDVLYLNPGAAHFGVAENLCVTASIGMRAPTLAELGSRTPGHAEVFYTDPARGPETAPPGYIDRSAVRRAVELLGVTGLSEHAAESALGRFATANKPGLEPEPPDVDAPPDQVLNVHGMARLAYGEQWLFANGAERDLPRTLRACVAELCTRRAIDDEDRARWRQIPGGDSVLGWLWRHAAFDLPD